MRKLILAVVLGLIALSFGASASHAQAASGFAGKAVRWNGDAIAGATIAVLRGPLETDQEVAHTTTAADGSYNISVPAGGPYYVHIRTFGTWWGYTYKPTFTLVDGEQVSQIYFVLGPRDVHEITLPNPVSSVGGLIGGGDATPTPVANVGGLVGGPGDIPVGMPTTGAPNDFNGSLFLALGGALALIGLGFRARVLATRS